MSERCCRLTAPPWALMRVRHPPHVLFTAGTITETTGLTTVHPRPNACRQPRKPQAWWVMYQQNTLALWRWEHWFNYQCSQGFLLQKCTIGKSARISGTRTCLSPKHRFPSDSGSDTRFWPLNLNRNDADATGRSWSERGSSAVRSEFVLSTFSRSVRIILMLVSDWLLAGRRWLLVKPPESSGWSASTRLEKPLLSFLTYLLRARVQRECHETFLSYSILTKIRVLFLYFQWGKK